MSAQLHSVDRAQPSQGRSHSLLLQDLTVASQTLPLDAVLPEQYYSSTSMNAMRGEVALMRAVLEDAISCFQGQFTTNREGAQRLGQEAEEWIFANDPHWLFSFVNICAVLEIDPEYLRSGLLHWRERHSAGQLNHSNACQ